MPSGKDRIYVALYARGGSRMPGMEDRYHWALVVGPQVEGEHSEGTIFHARERMSVVDGQAQSKFEFHEIDFSSYHGIALIRVLFAKVAKRPRVEYILRSTSAGRREDGWNCVSWVKEAIKGLEKDKGALGTARSDWEMIQDAAMRYVKQKKIEHRFDGKGSFDMKKVATWSLLDDVEIVP